MKKTIILSFLIFYIFSCVDNKYLTLDKKLYATISTKIDTLTAALTASGGGKKRRTKSKRSTKKRTRKSGRKTRRSKK